MEGNFEVIKCVCVCVCVGKGGGGGGGAVKPQRDGTIFMEEVDPSRNHVKILIGQLQEGQVGLNA